MIARLMGLFADVKNRPRKAARSAGVSVLQKLTNRHYLELDYPPTSTDAPRYGHGKPPHPGLLSLIAANDELFAQTLASFAQYRQDLAKIDLSAPSPTEPYWCNDFLPGLDGIALYAYVRERAPARYLEIGSGNSTMFVARARRDGGGSTRLTSIDPHPRAEIDVICDDVMRRPLEDVGIDVFAGLESGDILFFDGSHRVFMNSDVTAFFLDVLPVVPPGVLIGIHDIHLPSDYPRDIADRFYSEQYMLAAYLLGGADVQIEFAAKYVCESVDLANAVDTLWARHEPAPDVFRNGVAFWFTKRS